MPAHKVPTPGEIGLPDDRITAWRPGQEESIDLLQRSKERFVALCAPTGFGKCFRPGTSVLMYDMTTKPVEDVEVGDLVMGPDGRPRQVDSLSRGIGLMHRVQPVKGDPYFVNSQHILSVVLTPNESGQDGTYEDLSVRDFYGRSTYFRHRAKGYRSQTLEFDHTYLDVNPYFLGLWLGDGHSKRPAVTTSDTEIVDYIYDYARSRNLEVYRDCSGSRCPSYILTKSGPRDSTSRSCIHQDLINIGVLGNKHIPLPYLRSNTTQRLSLLAGLIDSDGHLIGGCYEITQKYRLLAEGIVTLCRSLGLAAYLHPEFKSCQTGAEDLYYRVTISGDISKVPVIITRKQAHPRQQVKSVLRTGIVVTPDATGEFAGFSVMGSDQHFLLADFTVVHNSGVVVADALLSGEPSAIVTNSRGLQDQYLKIFGGMGLVDLRGRANYQCQCKPDDPEYTCEDGYVSGCPYKGTVACPSSQAEMRAGVSNLVVTNYAKWTYSKKMGMGLDHIKRVYFDEAHNAPGAIAQAMQVTMNSRECEEELRCPFPRGTDADDMREWKSWATVAKAAAEVAMQMAQARITGVSDPKRAWIKKYTHYRNLVRRLAILQTARPDEWVVEQVEKGYQFDPIRPGRYAESTLFLRVPKVVMVSATLRPKTLFMCWVAKDNFVFKEFDSDFDSKRCPIYYVPTMRVDRRASDMGPLWAMLDRWIAKRRTRKGIIHTVSYARQEDIQNSSRFHASMIINPKGSPATETVDLFKQSAPGTILVSPSVGEGYDFPDDECRWQFMSKIPFEPPSKIVKAREADDKEYRAYQATQQLVQAFGRGMRSKTDWCENVIGDEHLAWFLPRYGHLAPKSFHGFYKHMQFLPQPLDL